eukprot:scaffold18987_cov109-Isochrysis_galbana.AAC.20
MEGRRCDGWSGGWDEAGARRRRLLRVGWSAKLGCWGTWSLLVNMPEVWPEVWPVVTLSETPKPKFLSPSHHAQQRHQDLRPPAVDGRTRRQYASHAGQEARLRRGGQRRQEVVAVGPIQGDSPPVQG